MPSTATKNKKLAKTNTAAERPISRSRYATLLKDVKHLFTSATKAVDEEKVKAQWRLGQRITQERLSEQRGYHNSILRDLAADMHVGVRSLQYAVKFHRNYRHCPRGSLSWSHYRLLLDRPDAASRKHYEQLALSQSLTSPELQRRIALDQRGPTDDSSPLPRPTDANYLYRAKVIRVIDGDTLELSIDLGFNVNRTGSFRLADIDTPELDRRGDSRIARDADRADNADRANHAGRLARDFVYTRLLNAQTIVVKTERADLHGRYVTHLFYAEQQIPTATCFTEGTYLNAELLTSGHAVLVV